MALLAAAGVYLILTVEPAVQDVLQELMLVVLADMAAAAAGHFVIVALQAAAADTAAVVPA